MTELALSLYMAATVLLTSVAWSQAHAPRRVEPVSTTSVHKRCLVWEEETCLQVFTAPIPRRKP